MTQEESMDWNNLSQPGAVVAVGGTIESALTTMQPIRDLAKNWDIDIAACLEEYLVDLEFSQETREHIIGHATGCDTNNTSNLFNFAQAAIVLQNSSGIYSRKVDYLHSYAFKMQDDLMSTNYNANHKGGNNRKSGGNGSIDLEIEEFFNFDPHQEFLPLNDVIPTCEVNEYDKKINLHRVDDDDNVDSTRLSMSIRRRSSFLDSISRRRSSHRRSIGSNTLYLDQTFMSESGSHINTAARNALLGALDTTGTLRLQSGVCDIGDDGILRIPGSSSQEPISQYVSNDTNSGHDGGANFDMGLDDDDDDDHEDGGFVMADNDIEINGPAVAVNQEKSKRVTFSDSTIPFIPVKTNVNHNNDPWSLLDRDANVRKPRPLRIGKTVILPEAVDKPPSECVTGARTRHNARIKQARVPRLRILQSPLNVTTGSDTSYSNMTSLGSKRALEKNPLSTRTALAYGNEFAYIAKALAKRQADKRRELRNSINRESQQHYTLDSPTRVQEDDEEVRVRGMGRQFNDDEDDENDFDYAPDNSGINVFADADDAPVESNTGIASLADIYQNRNRDNVDDETYGETRSFEELCRAHIAAFARGAEKYAAETKLSARVGQWQGKLIPLLEEEDRRPVFDIHLYGDTVIKKMERQIKKNDNINASTCKPTKVVAFRDVTRDCQPFDVCRMFLAALSLNNSGNIQFTSESTLNALQVELVSSEIERPMKTYLAPSC